MLSVGYSAARGMFFDRARVQRAADAATRRVLSKFGAFVRTRAKTSIRKRRAISLPGMPPSSHEGTLRRLIFFGYDMGAKSVVIGPTQSKPGSIVPRVLEEGGVLSYRGKTRFYRPRPFMAPAFEAELPKVPPMFVGAVR